jgi:hypothetical protein
MITFKEFIEFSKDISNIGTSFFQKEIDLDEKEVTYKYTYTGYGMYTKTLCDPNILNVEIEKKEEELNALKNSVIEVTNFLKE